MTTPVIDDTGFDLDLVHSNLNRAITMIGTNLAIFTFALIFLYPRYASNQLNGVLFQPTLTSSLLAIFLFGFSGLTYFEAVSMPKLTLTRKKILVRRGDSLFVLSLFFSTANPALILFTLGITAVAIIATILWTTYAGFVIRQGRQLRRTQAG